MLRLGYNSYQVLADLGVLRELPTTSLYLTNPLYYGRPQLLAQLVYERRNTFRLGRARVVVRSCPPASLEQSGGARVYVIDDHLESGIADDELPAAYRERLRTIWQDNHPAIMEWASDVVVPNAALADYYDWHPGAEIPKGTFDVPQQCFSPDAPKAAPLPNKCYTCHLGSN